MKFLVLVLKGAPIVQEGLTAAKRESDRLLTERERALDAESARVYAAEQRAGHLREQTQVIWR